MANTPFLDLVKPAGTDRALVSVINSNSDKIDGGVSTLSEQIVALQGKITDASKGTINLNDYKSTGMYSYNGNTSSNTPSTGSCTLIVQKYSNDFVVQIVSIVRSTVTEMWVRNFYNGTTWSEWARLVPGYTPTASYTPEITSGSEGATFSNKNFVCSRVGQMLFITGRFQITDVGSTPANNTVNIGLPSGFSCVDRVGPVGSIFLNKTGVDISDLSIRQGNNYLYIQSGAGGSNVLSKIGTGYVMVYATILIS